MVAEEKGTTGVATPVAEETGEEYLPPVQRVAQGGPIVKWLDYFTHHGIPVLPCRGKQPDGRLAPHGLHSATTDEATVARWLKVRPQANWAACTGPIDAGPWEGLCLVVLDVDDPDVAAALLERTKVAELTAVTRSPRGGLHVYALSRRRITNAKALKDGDGQALGDLKAASSGGGPGGVVVFAGSTPKGRYEFRLGPGIIQTKDALAWFSGLLASVSCRVVWGRVSDGRPARGGGDGKIPEGLRNVRLASIAGSLRRQGLGEEAIAAALLAVNEANCSPPLPEREVLAVAHSISRYPVGDAATPPISARQERPRVTYHLKEKAVVSRLVEVPASRVREEGLAGGAPLEYLLFLGLEGYIVRGWAHLLAGYPKAGKTELLTRLIQQWTDEQVVCITEEPQSLWAVRLARLPGTWDHVTLVFALGADPEAVLERIRRGDESVVVVDTIRSLLGIADESDNSEIARVLNPVIAACRERAATLLLAHHVRKAGGEHGAAVSGGHAFLGAVDVALELLRDEHDDRRRKVRGWGRVVTIPELLYTREDDGTFRPLGSPAQVELEAVKGRVLEVLNGTWQSRKDILAGLDEPKPSFEQVRLALEALVDEGEVERDPAQPRRGATYRYRLAGGTD